MYNTIKDPEKYFDYFRWHRYYSFQSPVESAFTIELCDLCAVLDERIKSKSNNVFPDIVNWWNGNYTYNITSTESPTEDQ